MNEDTDLPEEKGPPSIAVAFAGFLLIFLELFLLVSGVAGCWGGCGLDAIPKVVFLFVLAFAGLWLTYLVFSADSVFAMLLTVPTFLVSVGCMLLVLWVFVSSAFSLLTKFS